MNPAYLATFRRHRPLFVLLIVFGIAFATWVNVGEPPTYRSSASIWFDTVGQSPELTGATAVAAQEQSMLNEMLATAYFRNQVARASSLDTYLKAHPPAGWGPASLLARLRGPGSLDDRIGSALSTKRVTSIVKGPHVLKVSYDAPTPVLAKETLAALLREYADERTRLQRDALSHFKAQVDEASTVLADARTDLAGYAGEHPGSNTANDPHLRRLAQLQRGALERLDDATAAFDEASTAALNPASAQGRLRVVDPPKLPTAPNVGPKRVAFGLFGGLFGGVIVSLLGIVLLTRLRHGTPAEETAEAAPIIAPSEGASRVAAARRP